MKIILLLFALIYPNQGLLKDPGRFKRYNEPTPSAGSDTQEPAESWNSFVKHFDTKYLSYDQNSSLPRFAQFEKEIERFVEQIVLEEYTEPSYYYQSEYRKLLYHHYDKNTDSLLNETLEFRFSGDRQEKPALVKIPGSTIADITKERVAILLLAEFDYEPMQRNGESTSKSERRCINSNVVSVSLFQVEEGSNKFNKRSIPIVYELGLNKGNADCFRSNSKAENWSTKITHSCEFYNSNLSAWSNFGCEMSRSSIQQRQSCSCNHTTSFAVLLSVTDSEIEIPSPLETVIQVAEGISVFLLLFTIAVLVTFRRLIEPDRLVTQIGISVSLMLFHLSFLFGSLALKLQLDFLCVCSTVLAHFFTISSACWMLNEAIMLLMKIRSSSLKLKGKTYKYQLIFSGWLAPALYVAVCAGVGLATGTYVDKKKLSEGDSPNTFSYNRCWLSGVHRMTLSVVIPVTLILALNSAILIRTVRVVRKMDRFVREQKPKDLKEDTKWKSRHSQFLATLRATIFLLPVLGIPWVIGFLVNTSGFEVIFSGIHGIINGLQGVFIFLIFCFKNNELRNATKRKIIDFTVGLSGIYDSSRG